MPAVATRNVGINTFDTFAASPGGVTATGTSFGNLAIGTATNTAAASWTASSLVSNT